jgi:alpha-tubulin suppressor-like RCC1 family protein
MKKVLIGIGIVLLLIFIVNSRKNNSSIANSPKGSSNIVGLGENNTAQLGLSPNELDEGTHTISELKNVSQIAAGRNFSLARTQEGQVYVWGGNDWGQLGLGVEESRKDQPIENQNLKSIKKIAASNNNVLALSEDGHVFSFGSNFSGQLGTGDNTDSNTPGIVAGIDHVVDVAPGYKFSVALKDDGTVWAWGAKCSDAQKKESEQWWKTVIGKTDEVGDGYYDPTSDALSIHDKDEYCINEDIVGILSRTPVQIKNLSKITQISAGYGHVLALDTDGNVWSFGCNTFHQLGRVTKEKSDNTTPQKISGLPPIAKVSAGYRHSLAVTNDGAVWSWGLNSHGQLGVEAKELLNTTPLRVSIDHVSQILSGYDYSLVVKDDGTVWGWGRNIEEWFDDDSFEYVSAPKQVKRLQNISQIAAGGAHIIALSKN